MAAPRTQAKKEADRLQVSRLYLENRPIGEIARAVGINRLTVLADIRAIREEWAHKRVGNFSAWVAGLAGDLAGRLALTLARRGLVFLVLAVLVFFFFLLATTRFPLFRGGFVEAEKLKAICLLDDLFFLAIRYPNERQK